MGHHELVIRRQPTSEEFEALQKLHEFTLAVDNLPSEKHRFAKKQPIRDLCTQARMWLINECWDFERPLEED